MNNIVAEWMGKDVKELPGEHSLGRMGVVVEVISDEKNAYHARISKDDGEDFWCPVLLLKKLYPNPKDQKFVEQVRKAGMTVRYYDGRNFFSGPAVVHADPQAVIRATTMPVQWDNMGKTDFIIYPKR